MLSVTTPLNFCFSGTATNAAIVRRPKSSGFMPGLFARGHQVGSGRARVHDPHTALLAVFRQAEGLGGRAGNGDGHVRPKVLRVGAHLVIPDRSELGFYTSPAFFSGIECSLAGLLVGDGLELQVLRNPIQVGDTGAL